MSNKPPPNGSERLLDVADTLGWRVSFHGSMPDGSPIAALYNASGGYVGLVCVIPNLLVTLVERGYYLPPHNGVARGEWLPSELIALAPLQSAYAQC